MTRVRRGITLVEITMVIAILGIIGSVASGLIFSAATAYADASTTAQLHAEATVALETVTRALREIPRDAAATGVAPDIDRIRRRRIRFDGNALIARVGTELRYRESGGVVRRVMSDVTAFDLQSYDANDVPLPPALSGTACDPIRRIEITMTVTRNGVSETLRTKVYLRSMMGEAP